MHTFIEQTNDGTRIGVDSVAVVGLGFVGLPLALSFSLAGLRVYGLDINAPLISELQSGITYHLEAKDGMPIRDVLNQEMCARRFQPSSDPAVLENCRDIVVTVGMPVRDGKPDKEPLLVAARMIATHMKVGTLVLLRSTMVPGAIEGDVVPLLESVSGLKAGRDFYVAYASERIAEGRAFEEFASMPVTVAGICAESTRRATSLLKTISHAELITSNSIKAVEVAKVLENMHRDINIAIVNEMAEYCRSIGEDILEVVRLANTHTRVNLLVPGAGVGGYCIPNAYYYMAAARAEPGLPLAHVARQVNDRVPRDLANLVIATMTEAGIDPRGAKVAVLGLAMKDYSNDDRQSAVYDFISALKEMGVRPAVYDPNVHGEVAHQAETEEQVLAGASAIAVMIRQNNISYDPGVFAKHAMKGAVILDVRRLVDRTAATQLGFHYITI